MAHVLRNIQIGKALDLRHAYGESGYAGKCRPSLLRRAKARLAILLSLTFSVEEIAHKPRPLTKIVRQSRLLSSHKSSLLFNCAPIGLYDWSKELLKAGP